MIGGVSLSSKKREYELYKKNLQFIRPYWFPLSIVLIIMILEVVFTLFVAKYQEFFINRINEGNISKIIFMIELAIPLGLSIILIRFFQNFIRYYYHSLHIRDLSFQVVKKINLLKLSFLRKKSVSDYVTRATGDVGQTANMIEGTSIEIVLNLLVIICSCYYLKDVDLFVTITALLSGPIIFIMGRMFDKKIKRLSLQIQEKQALIRGMLQEVIQGLETIKVFNLQQHYLDKYVNEKTQYNQLFLKRKIVLQSMEEIINVFINVVVILITFVISISTIEGKISIGSVMSSIYLLLRIQSAYSAISISIGEMQISIASAERVFAIVDEEDQLERILTDKSHEVIDGEGHAVEVANLMYAYPDVETEERRTLKNVSLQIAQGEKVGIIGESGSGKSTLVKLMLGLHDEYLGVLKVHGREVRDNVKFVRSHIAYVPQDVLLLPGTIRENLMLGSDEKSEQEMIEAAKVACAHSFIMEFSEGYDTNISELGKSLSGGQAQRICLARALLKDSDILILDEPTSSLDEHNETQLIQNIFETLQEKTVIMITHNVQSLQKVDRIYVIDEGQQKERGIYLEV